MHRVAETDLSECYALTDASLVHIGTHCTQLRDLNISGNDNYTDAGLTALAAGCRALTILNIQYMFATTAAGVIALVNVNKDLTHLSISNPQITEVSLSAIARNCAKLQYLFLRFSPQIQQGVSEILQHCSELVDFVVYTCGAVDPQWNNKCDSWANEYPAVKFEFRHY